MSPRISIVNTTWLVPLVGRAGGWWRLRWIVISLSLALGSWLCGQEVPVRLEDQVKGVFLVKFASYIDWPAECPTNTSFKIGVLGRDPFGKQFDEAARREKVAGRPVEIRRSDRPESLFDCHIVFVSNSESARLKDCLKAFDHKPILLVTDQAGAATHGSMINFFKEDGKVRFEFNLVAATHANLHFSAKLLQVGRIAVGPCITEGGQS